ncbi:MAG: hypothetical protein CMM50_12495 [Rhodospirillaceae bacterium]|nr:hypothetical protein [Rhodospirillaceae bacterium]|tara:strand:+ start:1472 stop:1939 length:468 start_codon:yes stop_codon:yes gene_type:complete
MQVFESVAALADRVGEELGTTEWMAVTQDMIDAFADVTGDRQWIHIDVARARTESPFGTTVAHGFLTLSLVPMLMQQIFRIEKVAQSINYGSDRIRFPAPVPAGARIRGRHRLKAADPLPDGGFRLVHHMTVEVENGDKPGCVAEVISVIYPAAD